MTAQNGHGTGVDTLGNVLAMAEAALKAAARLALRDLEATDAERQAMAARFRMTANAVAAMAAVLPSEILAWTPSDRGGR